MFIKENVLGLDLLSLLYFTPMKPSDFVPMKYLLLPAFTIPLHLCLEQSPMSKERSPRLSPSEWQMVVTS